MSENLVARDRAFVANMDPAAVAKRLAPKLRELAEELLREARQSSGPKAELRELEAHFVASAAELLRVLEQEQWRQREAAKHHLDGRMDRHELREVTRTWNAAPGVRKEAL